MGGLTRRLLVGGGVAGAWLPARGQTPAARVARPAAAFVDSMGVDIHLNVPAYATQADMVAARLHELGVRHVREGFGISDQAAARLNAIAEATGIRATLISSPITNTPQAARDAILQRFGVANVAAVEGVNEPDGWFREQPAAHGDWVAATVQHQCELYRAIKATPALAMVTVLGPAVINVDAVDRLAGTAPFCDAFNIHPYPGAWNPETAGWGGAMRGFGYGSLDWAEANAMPRLRPGKPVMATETGYHNAYEASSPHLGVPEAVAGIYLPRLFLYYFGKGVARTFSYELLDEGDDGHDIEACFGLLRHDGARKPGFIALRNLIALLADAGPRRAAGSLDIALSGPSEPVQSVLLQKSNGVFYLAAWLPRRVWDPATHQGETAAPAPLHVALGREMRDIAVCMPNDGVEWRTIGREAGAVDLDVSERVTLIRLRPH